MQTTSTFGILCTQTMWRSQMFGKKKKKEQSPDEEFEDIDEQDDVLDQDEDGFEQDDGDDDLVAIDDDEESGVLKRKYSNLSRMFHKHLIYVRIATLISISVLLGGALMGGVISGLHTQGAKAREVTGYGTTLPFSKTGASVTVGRAYRNGNNILIPVYNDGTSPIDTSHKATGSNGSFSGVTSTLALPSYGSGSSNGSAAFIPISAKNYRMYVSALKGKLSPSTQVRYVKFGATGIGAIVLSNVQADTTIRVLLENKKIYKVPGANSPGLTVDGHPVNTNRDVILINTNLASTRPSDRKFSINSSPETLLKIAYADDYMRVWHSDKSVMNKLEKVDKQKLLELQSNKSSLDASSAASSQANSSSQNSDAPTDSQTAIDAQQTIVNADNDSQSQLDASKTALNDYVKRVASQMTMSSEYQLK